MSDPRNLLARPELADARLEGLVRADRFADVTAMTCAVPIAGVRRAPADEAELDDELLLGEGFDVLDTADGWAWGQARRDGYVGHVRLDQLARPGAPPTHRIAALRTYGFARPDLKSPARGPVSLNALVTAERETAGFLECGAAGWIFHGHLAPIGAFEPDPAAVAERFVGAPYLWGGRSSLGLDCSGLVQQAMYACGRACPRDADQQLAAFPRAAAADALRRGDLVFWTDHVGMMLDGERLLHANGHHMAAAVEPLARAVERIRAADGGEPAFRRP